MLNIIMILIFGVIVHNLSAMETELKKYKKPKSNSFLGLPDSSKSSHKGGSPNSSQSSSPETSPRKSIKISPRRDSRGELLKVNSPSHQEEFERLLWLAITNNNRVDALKLIHPNMNIIDYKSSKTILIMAIKDIKDKNDEEVVLGLLSHKNIDVNKPDKWGNTPLHHATLGCNEAIIRFLLYDFRVNSALKNTNGFFIAYKFTDHEFYLDKDELKKIFLARTTLDTFISEILPSYKDGYNSLDDMIINIMNLTTSKVGTLPSYMTCDFIKSIIVYRINESNKTKEEKIEVSSTFSSIVSKTV